MNPYSFEKNIKFSDSNLHTGGELIGVNNGAKNGFCIGISYYNDSEYGEPGIHDDQEGFYVLEGTGYAMIGDIEIIINPGTGFIASSGVPHSIKCSPGCKYVKLLWAHGAI